jgi:hypothetical protein
VNEDRTPNPVDQLLDLFVYAPIGLLYEREDVLPRLVNRGRNQVQVARVLSQLAVQRGQGQLEDRLSEVVGPSAVNLARVLTEIGAMLGLTPPPQPPADTTTAVPTTREPADGTRTGDSTELGDGSDGTAGNRLRGAEPAQAASLPIARYDELPAREILPLLADLTPSQRRRVRDHEASHRNRKTVLHQIERLGV